MNNQKFEFVGKLKPEIAKYWNLNEHANKPIVIYKNVRQHIIARHLKDFGSVDKIDFIWSKLRVIIKRPDQVFYNEQTKGLEYYKKIDNVIVVAIRISFSSTLKIKSFYPANKTKMKNRETKEKRMIIEGKVNDTILI